MTDAENFRQAAGPRKARLVPTLALLAGAALIVLGVWCIGAYANAVVEVWDSSDRSLIYWLLFLPALGIALITAGAYFVVIGWLARRGSSTSITLARYSLVALAGLVAVALLSGHYRLQQVEREGREQDKITDLRRDRVRDARRISRLELAIDDHRRLGVRADLADGLDGRYRMTLTVATDQAVLHETSRQLQLQGKAAPVIHELAFDALFADCFATGNASRAYACVKGAGVEETYTVAIKLELIEDARGALSANELRYDPIAATAAAEVLIDTMTTQDAVVVKSIRRL